MVVYPERDRLPDRPPLVVRVFARLYAPLGAFLAAALVWSPAVGDAALASFISGVCCVALGGVELARRAVYGPASALPRSAIEWVFVAIIVGIVLGGFAASLASIMGDHPENCLPIAAAAFVLMFVMTVVTERHDRLSAPRDAATP